MNWLKSYLSGRVQYVYMGQITSEGLEIACGVPQGSVLGPKLFILYINDIFTISKMSKFMLFADGTNVFYSGNNYKNLIKMVNEELSIIKRWMDSNTFSINLNKTKVIIFGNQVKPSDESVNIDGTQIESVQEYKFLGIIIDSKLTWKPHIRHTKTKIAKSLSIINSVKSLLDSNTLRILYCSLVLPYFSYCAEVWGNSYQCSTLPTTKKSSANYK